MNEFYEPKPTDYLGITYRSRLEARYAVLLENHKEIVSYQYEPMKFTDKSVGDYTPDFLYMTNKGELGLLEVKPARPSSQYIQHLNKYAHYLPQTIKDFVIAYGDFFNGNRPLLLDCFLSGEPYNHLLFKYDHPVNFAGSYRFDLEPTITFGPNKSKKHEARMLKAMIDTLYSRNDRATEQAIKKWIRDNG